MFKNISTWSKRKLSRIYALFETLYLLFALFIPVTIISIKYSLFNNAITTSKSINGLLLIVLVVVAIVGIRALKKVVDRLDCDTNKSQWIKYSLQTIYGVLIPILCCVALICFKSDFNKAFDTFTICLIFYTVGVVIDKLFVSFTAHEKELRNEVIHKQEIEKRMNL